MEGIKNKQNKPNFKIKYRLYLKKNPHYPVSDLVLYKLLYIFEAKKRCNKKRFE